VTTSPVFLAPKRLIEGGDRVVLDGPEGRHAAKVRRLAPGEALDLVDGDGLRVRCLVDVVTADGLVVLVQSRVLEPDPQPRVVVIQALAKGDRGERAVEVLTEVGADEIVPWAASRSVIQWHADRGDRALERWRSIARESAKQSRRARFPVITPLATTGRVAARLSAAACALVLDEHGSTTVGAIRSRPAVRSSSSSARRVGCPRTSSTTSAAPARRPSASARRCFVRPPPASSLPPSSCPAPVGEGDRERATRR